MRKNKTPILKIMDNVLILIQNKVHPSIILFALKGDGIDLDKGKTIIRWAQQKTKSEI